MIEEEEARRRVLEEECEWRMLQLDRSVDDARSVTPVQIQTEKLLLVFSDFFHHRFT